MEFEVWQQRRLDDREVVYAWADGIYVKAGLEKEKAALLVVIGTQFRAYVSDRGHASLDEDHGSR